MSKNVPRKKIKILVEVITGCAEFSKNLNLQIIYTPQKIKFSLISFFVKNSASIFRNNKNQ